MYKKILCIVSVAFILVTTLIPIASAAEYIVSPDTDEQPLYTIYPSKEYGVNDLKYYTIYGYNANGISAPSYKVPLVRNYFGDPDELSDGVYEYNLYSTINNSHTSSLQLTISSNSTMMILKYVVRNLVTNVQDDTFLIPYTSTNNDLVLFADNTGQIFTYYYNHLTLETVEVQNYSGLPLKVNFYGDIYLFEQGPSDEDSQDAYNRGLEEGKTIGYQSGAADQQEIYNQSIDAIKQAEFDAGYAVGKEDGILEASMSDDQKTYWYNAGYTAGQNTNGLVEEGITGFWNAMQGFIEPFLNIGIGSLRVYTILALLLIGGLAFIIIRLTRG